MVSTSCITAACSSAAAIASEAHPLSLAFQVAQTCGTHALKSTQLFSTAHQCLHTLQVALLQRQAAAHNWHDVEVLTVDKCQGRDKPALLLSLVRSNPEGSTGRLLADWRRVNVALTRAQKKLVLVGSAQTLTSVPLFEELLTLVKTQGWLIKLPAC